MKKLTLKIGKEKVNGNELFFTTLGLLKTALNHVVINANAGNSGLTVEEMATRLKIMTVLEEHKEMDVAEGELNDAHLIMIKDIQLEDADFNKLKELFNAVRWGVVSQFIVDTANQFKN